MKTSNVTFLYFMIYMVELMHSLGVLDYCRSNCTATFLEQIATEIMEISIVVENKNKSSTFHFEA